MPFSYPEHIKTVVGKAPTTTNSAVTGDIVCLKNAINCWVEFIFTQAAAHATVCTIYESDDVAGTTTAAITATMPNWKNADISATDSLVQGTDAATVTLAATTKNQHVIVQVDPAVLSSGYDCIYGYTSASSQAANFVTILYHIETAYPQSNPPSAKID
jgi:hypothetical protein